MEGSADVSTSPTQATAQPEAQEQTQEEASAGGEDPSGSSQDGSGPKTDQKSATEKRKLKFRAKVDGSEEDVELDEETIQRDYQKWRASEKKFQEAARKNEETKKYFEDLKKDKWKVFHDLGLDPHAEAESLLIEKMKLEMMSPAERRAYDLEKENMTYKERLQAAESREQERQAEFAKQKQEAVELQISADLGQEIVDAIKATGAKPSPRLVTRMAEHMLAKYSSTGEKLSAADALKFARRSLVDDASSYLADLPLDEVKKILPKTFLDGLRKSDVEAVLAQDPVGKVTQVAGKPQYIPKALKRGSTDQIFDNLFEKKFKR